MLGALPTEFCRPGGWAGLPAPAFVATADDMLDGYKVLLRLQLLHEILLSCAPAKSVSLLRAAGLMT